jgi:hypothetical protein
MKIASKTMSNELKLLLDSYILKYEAGFPRKLTLYKELPSYDYLKECFTYDFITGDLIWKERPITHFSSNRVMNYANSQNKNKIAGVLTKVGYLRTRCGEFGKYMNHRIIWKLITGNEPDYIIDHIDCDKMNNRFNNLRECNTNENARNCLIRIDNSSGLKGVHFDNSKGKYISQIGYFGNRIQLGAFDDKEVAYEIYKFAATYLHLDFKNYG